MIEKIGTNAGIVWYVLDGATAPMDLKSIKKQTKLSTEREVLLALGWLAKEGKLVFEGSGRDFTVRLAR